ncbi:DUF3047 domain-containing protein [Piscinibacter sp.]|uniref:DUF3047 domain-containing protein n=1 Tax=Piscinibacter sp. TaxID=1903157 RepID=UPI0039E450E4
MIRRCFLLLSLALGACASGPEPASALDGPWAGWQNYPLPGKRSTVYRTQRDGARFIVQARADASASMLRRPWRVDAAQLARAQFSWRVTTLVARADLADAEASDSPVRLVFAFDGDHGRLSPRNRMLFELARSLTGEPPPYATLVYAWDNRAERESVIQSRRSDRVRKIVLESGAARLGQWRHYERDIAADFRRAFGEEPGALLGVALMTDADNTAGRAGGEYGEVRLFTRDGTPL